MMGTMEEPKKTPVGYRLRPDLVRTLEATLRKNRRRYRDRTAIVEAALDVYLGKGVQPETWARIEGAAAIERMELDELLNTLLDLKYGKEH